MKKEALQKLMNELNEVELFKESFGSFDIVTQNKIKHIIEYYLNEYDYLNKMLKMQHQLDDFIVKNKAKFKPDIKDKIVEMIVESVEALEHTNHKWWSSKNKFNRYKLFKELTDQFHFYLSSVDEMNFTAKDIFEYYSDKHSVNIDRAKSDY